MAILASGAAIPLFPLRAQQNSSSELNDLLEASAAADEALSPLSAERGGRTPFGPAFVDPLGDGYAQRLERNKRAELARLETIDRGSLNPTDRIAYDVFRYKTRQTLDLFDDGLFKLRQLAPLNPAFGLQVELPDYVANEKLESVEDYDRAISRLQGFSGYLANTVRRLREGVAAGVLQPKT
jgi:uncharacterized protein (DUF885 family)